MAYDSQIVRAKENLKWSHGWPSQRQACPKEKQQQKQQQQQNYIYLFNVLICCRVVKVFFF